MKLRSEFRATPSILNIVPDAILLGFSATLYFVQLGFASLMVLLFYLVIQVPTHFTTHLLTENAVFIRQGLYFQKEIPYKKIRSVAKFSGSIFLRTGVQWLGLFFEIRARRVFIVNSHKNLLSIALRSSVKVFGRKIREIILNMDDTEGFLIELRKKMGNRAMV